MTAGANAHGVMPPFEGAYRAVTLFDGGLNLSEEGWGYSCTAPYRATPESTVRKKLSAKAFALQRVHF